MRNLVRFSILSIVAICVSACGPSNRTKSTFEGPDFTGPAFKNMLIIGIAGDYNSRADFERMLAREISVAGTSATPYYSVVDMEAPIARSSIEAQVQEGEFDAVLITRVLNRDVENKVNVGSTATKRIRQEGGVVDLFRYDYEELNEPATLSVDINVVIEVEVFAVDSQARVWAIEADMSHHDSREELTLAAVKLVSSELRRGGLISQ